MPPIAPLLFSAVMLALTSCCCVDGVANDGETTDKNSTNILIPIERVKSSKVLTRQHSIQLPTASFDVKYEVRLSLRLALFWSKKRSATQILIVTKFRSFRLAHDADRLFLPCSPPCAVA